MSLQVFARLTSAAAFVLLIAGGLVTSTGSGLAVPDWPLSFGQAFPPMVGGVFFEHGHRMAAGTVGILVLVLSVWIHLREERRWVRRLALAVSGAILVQAVLGGVTVLWGLPKGVSVAHASLGQAVFCMLVALAQSQSEPFQSRRSAPGGRLWVLGVAAFAAAYLQLVLGAVLRHTGTGLGWHLGGAFVASVAGLALAYRALGTPPAEGMPPGWLSKPAAALALLVPLQVILGVAAFAAKTLARGALGPSMVLLPTAHVACGALILGTLCVSTMRAYEAGA